MKLNKLAAKPVLIEVKLDDEETIKEHGEAVEFWTWDRQPMAVFMALAKADQTNFTGIIDIIRTLILDEKGKEILKDEVMLPTGILMKAIAKVTDLLGK